MLPTTRQVQLCSVEDIPSGLGFRVEQGELPEAVAVFNDNGKFYALSDMCSHAAASLSDGEVVDCAVECPLHWARFDLATGAALTLPAAEPVKTYPVIVVAGQVYITLSEEEGR